jgi:ACT domain-containing protein
LIQESHYETGLNIDERLYYYRTGNKMNKTIITVVGKDTVGIIAKVCTYLADNQVNVEDISQTIVQGYFNMMMIVDTERSSKPFSEMVTDLENLGDEIGVRIRCQREDIFTKMHRI